MIKTAKKKQEEKALKANDQAKRTEERTSYQMKV